MFVKRLQYRYDAVGNKVGMTDADGGLFTYTYDVMRRLTGVINPQGVRTTYTYDLNGRRATLLLGSESRISYTYDVCSRVQQIHARKSDGRTIGKFDYAYDDNGRRTSVLEKRGTTEESRVTWTYDATGQLTSEWRTSTTPFQFRHTFVYDTRGNRTLKIEDGARTTLVYDAANQLSSSESAGGTTTYTYDANGNQHVTVAPGGARTTQIWDYENRLVRTILPTTAVTSMAYDADGLRVRKETPTETKLFVWNDQNYLAETDESGVPQMTYTTEPSTYGSTLSQVSSGNPVFFAYDALGATRTIIDTSEEYPSHYDFTAFGTMHQTLYISAPFLWGGMVGYYWDADLGSHYIRARHYQPSIARWISLDPIGFAGGDANLFRYVGNSPTSGSMNMRIRLTKMALGELLQNFFVHTYADLLTSPRRRTRTSRLSHDQRIMDPSGLESIFDDISEEELYNSFVSPPKRCIFTMVDSHGPEGQGKWDEDGRRLLLRSGEGSELFTGVSNPSVMLGIIRSSGCCEVTMIGHRGGISYAGISTQSPSGSIGVFTDSFADHLGNALAANGCSTCSLRIFACQLCNASKEECEYWKVDPNILPAQDQAEQKMWNNVAKRTNCAVTVPTHFLSIGDSSIKRRARKEGHTCVPGGCTISAGTAPDYLEVDEPLIPPKTRTFTPFQLKRTR